MNTAARTSPLPVCLTVAGSDSGGGAGIQADLRAFADFGCFGVSAITVVTAQNPSAIISIHELPVAAIEAQLDAVAGDAALSEEPAFTIAAIKTGMLFSEAVVSSLARRLAARRVRVPLVVDPVMVATSGARLIDDRAIEVLRSRLLPLATIATPNLPEAQVLVGRTLRGPDDELAAARELAAAWGCAVLLKGGHRTDRFATDLLVDGERAHRLAAPRLSAATSHGTGCALSAAIAANLARGRSLLEAVRNAKAYVHATLANCRSVGANTFVRARPEPEPIDTRVVSVEELR